MKGTDQHLVRHLIRHLIRHLTLAFQPPPTLPPLVARHTNARVNGRKRPPPLRTPGRATCHFPVIDSKGVGNEKFGRCNCLQHTPQAKQIPDPFYHCGHVPKDVEVTLMFPGGGWQETIWQDETADAARNSLSSMRNAVIIKPTMYRDTGTGHRLDASSSLVRKEASSGHF